MPLEADPIIAKCFAQSGGFSKNVRPGLQPLAPFGFQKAAENFRC